MNELLPQARRVSRRLPGLVWAIPAAALIIVGYLGINAFLERGIEVVVTFESAAGAKVRDTLVTYKGVTVGRVTKIEMAQDQEHVLITLRISRKVGSLLTTGTSFWLVGAKPSLADLASLTAAVTGLSIEMAPGPGEPATEFVGLTRAPIIYPGTPGRRIQIETDDRDGLKPGARVAYHGDDAGKITDVRFVREQGKQGFIIEAFIFEPFAKVIREDSVFWLGGGVQVTLTASGVSTNIPAASELLAGGIAFDTPASALGGPEAPEAHTFWLFPNEAEARAGPDGEGVAYETGLEAASGVLADGAPVTLVGFRIGEVRSHHLSINGEGATVTSPVVVLIFPQRLGLNDDARGPTDAVMQRLLAHGYRLRATQSPPIVGPLALELVKGDGKAHLEPGLEYPRLPTTDTSDISALAATASSILTKLDAVPIQKIGDQLATSTERLSRALAVVEPELQPLLRDLRAGATAVQGTAVQARAVMTGEGAAQHTSIPEAMRELTEAARALRSLADTIERHPESLLFGKSKEEK